MNDRLQIHNDELNATQEEFKTLEELIGTDLPEEYKSFLQKHNGCTIFPNVPTVKADTNMMIWAIERFLSIGDLILQKRTKVLYSDQEYIEEYDGKKYPIDIDKLLTIAIAERGCYHIYLGEEEKGQIYSTCYSDGDGLVKFYTRSFSEFINTLGFYDIQDEHEYYFIKPEKSTKIFDEHLYNTFENRELGFERFKEVLKSYGNPNTSKGEGYKTVTETYLHNHQFLQYIISQGGNTEGLLNYVKNFETIQFLIKQYKLDINKPYEGKYPIHIYASAGSMYDHKMSYELIEKILISDIEVDLTVVDEYGIDFKTKLIKLNKGYMEYMEYEKRNGYFKADNWIRSIEIDKIINDL